MQMLNGHHLVVSVVAVFVILGPATAGVTVSTNEPVLQEEDSDGDGLSDEKEEDLGTDPNDVDTDDDTYWDGDEHDSGTDPLDETDYPHRDSDGDKYTDRDEVEHDTDPNGPDDFPDEYDSDGDKLTDDRERDIGTNPNDKDTDGDYYWDGDEWRANIDPTDSEDYPIRDSDADKYTDRDEVEHDTDPNNPNDYPDQDDSDGDKLTDSRERDIGTDPNRKDSDGDTYWDGDEWRSNTNPTDSEDYPHRDSDDDKYTDRDEVEHGTNPDNPNDYPDEHDSDGDKLTDDRERGIGTDPKDRDTDGDGYWDGDEWRSNSDPTGVSSFVLEQDDRCLSIPPLSGSTPVEDLYNYTYPERYDGPPGSDGDTFSSEGTTDLQRDRTSILFLYDGPEGLSLVIVHGRVHGEDDAGGTVTFTIRSLPTDGEWIVRDDYYEENGEPADSNFDRWDIDGDTHTIDWAYVSSRTDGGAFRSIGTNFEITIEPAFNDDAALAPDHDVGPIEAWELLSGDRDAPDRYPLRLDRPVTLRQGTCETGDDGEQALQDFILLAE